jgi:hypothetical protein
MVLADSSPRPQWLPGPPADEEVHVAFHRGRAQAAALLKRVTSVGHGVDRNGGGVGDGAGMGLMAQEEADHRVGATCWGGLQAKYCR